MLVHGLYLLSFIVAFLTALYFCLPYLFLYWKTFRNRFLFSGMINYPSPADKFINEPDKFDLKNTLNHEIELEKKGRIGIWEVKPEGEVKERVVILYCHGASSNRGKQHRVEFYQVYQTLGYTIIAFDYRGFGDSKGSRASEVSVVADCWKVLEWVSLRYPEHRVVLWGHSLGSGISTKFISELQDEADTMLEKVQGLVLESAFISAQEGAKSFPGVEYWNYFKITRDRIPRSLTNIFPTVDLLPDVKVPVLLLHAVDDSTIPHRHSEILYETCRMRGKKEVEFYSASSGQHRWVSRDEGAVRCAARFINKLGVTY